MRAGARASTESPVSDDEEEPFRDRPPVDEDLALDVLRHGEIDILGRMPWSSNGTFLCDLELDGAPLPDGVTLQAIYKPHRGERPLWDFPSGLFAREVACYELSKALGWDLVPPTVLRDGPLDDGSLQLFIPCDFDEHYFTMQDDDAHLDAFHRLTVFDFVANSTDRKAGHVLLGNDGRIWAIDNGLSFHVEFKLRTVLWDFGGYVIPEDIIEDLQAFVAGDFPEPLGELVDSFEVDAVISRARTLINEGRFPTDPSGRRWPWPLV